MMRTSFDLSPSVLIIDADAHLLESYTAVLDDEFQVYTATTGEEGLARLQREAIGLVILELLLSTMDGLEVLRRIKMIDATVPVIVITAVDAVRYAAEAFKLGAREYLVKPLDVTCMLEVVRAAMASPPWHGRSPVTPVETVVPLAFGEVVGQSTPMQQLATLLSRVADTDATVLITGESGVGKELVARALHQQSARAAGPFVAVHCGAMTEVFAERLLFGYERGVFTGAVTQHQGVFERAHRGTLLLDEVGSLRPEVQATLLRVLQERVVERVGGHQSLAVDVRLVATTNTDLRQLIEARTFREDLFYRLNVVPVHVPPLRDRREDIPFLVRHFLAHYNRVFGRTLPGLTFAALTVLARYSWPGNVRELEHCIARLVATSRPRVLDVADLPSEIRGV